MRFTETALAGVVVVEIEPHADDRGHFARTFCREEFARAGLPVDFPQCNLSFNARRGTLRGMHWQADPHPEGKLVRCTRGAIRDVLVDIRPESPTFRRWVAVELTEDNATAVFVPPGYAHGFQTLVDRSEVLYHMTEVYHPGLARGARWNDPAFGIDWLIADPILSPRDAAYPDLVVG
jgi:dTDP-4-dehydrorhamnose 3,5-epimerase